MPANDNPAEAGTVDSSTSLTIEQAADQLFAAQRDREKTPDNAPPAKDDTGPAKEAEVSAESKPPEKEKPAPDDWLADEDEPAKTAEEADPAADETQETGQFVTRSGRVKLDDGTIVSVKDLISGNMMQSDYSRKTEEAKQLKTTAETQLAAVKELEQSISEQRELSAFILANLEPQRPESALMDTDPLGYLKATAAYEEQRASWQQLVGAFRTSAEKQRSALTVEHNKRMEDQIRAEVSTLKEKMPMFQDAAKARKATEVITKMLVTDYGYKAEEVRDVLDHRFAMLAHDAARYRIGLSKSQKAIEGAKPAAAVVQKPGLRAGNSGNSALISDLTKRARTSGSIDDVLNLMVAEQKRA